MKEFYKKWTFSIWWVIVNVGLITAWFSMTYEFWSTIPFTMSTCTLVLLVVSAKGLSDWIDVDKELYELEEIVRKLKEKDVDNEE